MAARAFALQRPQDGNYVLEVARSLRPERHLGAFPTKLTVPLDLLPEDTRRWLKDQPARDIVKPLWSRGYLEAAAVMALSLVPLSLGLLAADASINATRPWDAGNWIGTAFLLALGAWAMAAGAHRVIRSRRSPLGKFTSLHQHYLVQADLDRVTFWPLINLVKVAVFAHQYGAGFGLRLKFGRRSARLNVSRKNVAESLANEAWLRGRVLDLLSSGLLEADGGGPRPRGAPLRPGAAGPLVAPAARPPLAGGGRGRRGAGGAGAAAHPGAGAGRRGVGARQVHGAAGGLLPGGAPGRPARRRGARQAGPGAGARAAPPPADAPGAVRGAGKLIEALRRAGTNRVVVAYAPSVSLGGFRAPPPFKMAQVSLPDAENLARHGRITTVLQKRIDALAGPGVVELRDGINDAPPPSPVRLEIRSVLGLSGEVYELEEDPALRYFGLAFRSSVNLKLGGGASEPAHHYDVEARPTREVRWNSGAFAPRYAYWQLANDAADVLGERLAVAMQMGE